MEDFERAKQLFFDGLSLLKDESYREAEAKLLESLRLVPDRMSTLVNLSAAQIGLEKYNEAEASARRALALDATDSQAWLNLGLAVSERNRTDAIEHFTKAIKLQPDNAEGWHNKGLALQGLQHFEEALAYFDQAIKLKPDYAKAHFSRGTACLVLQQFELARASLNLALSHGHQNKEQIAFMLASLDGLGQPLAPPKKYVSELFDDYAAKFESHLVNDLKYQSPGTLYGHLKKIIGGDLDVLDVGCGTGLMGELLKPHAKTLTGIDLSSKIIDEARAKNIYNQLYQADVNEFLQTNETKFDLIAAADVFVYLGDLSHVFSNVHKTLNAGGYFCFTVEKLDEGDFFLNTSLRYSHSFEYCEGLAKSNDFKIVATETNVIRQERGVDVVGYYFVMLKK